MLWDQKNVSSHSVATVVFPVPSQGSHIQLRYITPSIPELMKSCTVVSFPAAHKESAITLIRPLAFLILVAE